MNQEIKQLIDGYQTPETPGSFFLSLEGIEGSGKSTQIEKMRDFLSASGFRVLCLREPGGTVFGEKLREAILSSKTTIHPLAECHLFLASRAQLLVEKVLPFLLVPQSVVILDRYFDSTMAYQAYARGLGLQTALELHRHHPLGLLPHRTYFLDIDLETSMKRQLERGNQKDYFEAQNMEFYERLIEGYRTTASLFPDRVKTIDARVSMEDVATVIKKDLEGILL